MRFYLFEWKWGSVATNWVRYSASILYSSDEDVLKWEKSQITATNTAEFILSWIRFFFNSQLNIKYTEYILNTIFYKKQAVSWNVESTQVVYIRDYICYVMNTCRPLIFYLFSTYFSIKINILLYYICNL